MFIFNKGMGFLVQNSTGIELSCCTILRGPRCIELKLDVICDRILIEKMKARFVALGGLICEGTKFRSAEVFQDGIVAK